MKGLWVVFVAVVAVTLGTATAATDNPPETGAPAGPVVTVGDVRTAYVLNHHGEVNWPRGVRFEVDR